MTGGMPEIPAPPYQKLYCGYRYAWDATPKTASMDFHGRPFEPVISSCLDEGQTEMTLCNTGLRVSQVSPRVPEQASFSTARRRRPRADTAPLEHLDGEVSDDMKRFAWLG